MTEDELSRIPFRCTCCTAWSDEHTMTYSSPDNDLGFCVHTPKNEDGSFSKRTYTHYRIGERIYKTRKRFLEALKDYNPIRVAYREPEEVKTCDIVEFKKE